MAEPVPGRVDTRGGGKAPGAFRTISEVSDELDVPQHVLRFWETKFTQVKPMKRGGGRRYYRPEDLALLSQIRDLLYTDGYTIKGVQKLLREKGGKAEARESGAKEKRSPPANPPSTNPPSDSGAGQAEALKSVLGELEELKALLASPPK